MKLNFQVTRKFRQIKRIAHLMKRYELYEKTYTNSAFSLFANDEKTKRYWIGCIWSISLAIINKRIIGLAIHSHPIGFYGYEVLCYVKPEYRSRGIGSQLVIRLIKKDIDCYHTQFSSEFKEKIRYDLSKECRVRFA